MIFGVHLQEQVTMSNINKFNINPHRKHDDALEIYTAFHPASRLYWVMTLCDDDYVPNMVCYNKSDVKKLIAQLQGLMKKHGDA